MAAIRPENLTLVGGYRIPSFSSNNDASRSMGYPYGGMAFHDDGAGNRYAWVENGEQGKQVLECTSTSALGTGDPSTWPLMSEGSVWGLSDLFPGVTLNSFVLPLGLVYDHVNDRLIVSCVSTYWTPVAGDPSQWLAMVDYPGKTINATAKPDLYGLSMQYYGGGLTILPSTWASTHVGGKRLGLVGGGWRSGSGSPAGPTFAAMDLTPSATPSHQKCFYFESTTNIGADNYDDSPYPTKLLCERGIPDYYQKVDGSVEWAHYPELSGSEYIGYWATGSIRGGGTFVDDGTFQGMVWISYHPTDDVWYPYQVENLSSGHANTMYVYDLSDVQDAIAGTIDPEDIRARFYRWNSSINGDISGIARAVDFDEQNGYLWVYYPKVWGAGTEKYPIIAAYSLAADATAPASSGHGIVYKNGNYFGLTTDKEVTWPLGVNATGWSAKINDVADTITYRAGDGTNYPMFSFASQVYAGDEIKVSYDSGTGDVEDVSANALASFTDLVITNASTQELADTTSPTVISVSMDSYGRIRITFDEAVTFATVPNTSGLTYKINDTPVSITYANGDGQSTLIYTPASSYTSGDTLTLSYVAASGDIEDLAANALADFTDLEIVEYVDPSVSCRNELLAKPSSTYSMDYSVEMNMRMQETSGVTIDDRSNYNRDQTAKGMGANVTTRTGPTTTLSSALSFDGSNDYADFIGTTIFLNDDAITVAFWVQLDAQAADYRILGSNSSFSNNGYQVYLVSATGQLAALFRSVDTAERLLFKTTSDVDLDDGSWHKVVVRADLVSSEGSILIDDVEVAVSYDYQDLHQQIGQVTVSGYVGARHQNSSTDLYMDGGLADFTIANRLWTDQEALYWGADWEPLNTVAPTDPTGTFNPGETLTGGGNGTWDSDLDSVAYQWFRASNAAGTDRAAISGATSANYTLTNDDSGYYVARRTDGLNAAGYYDPAESQLSSFVGPIATKARGFRRRGLVRTIRQANRGTDG